MTASSGTATVVGGLGAVGSMFVELLRAGGSTVTVVDPAGIDPDGDVVVGDITKPSEQVLAHVESSRIIVLAVPEQVALAALPSLRTSGALVVDTLSVKSRMDAAIADAGREGEFLGLNPMFRPSLGPRGRAVIAVPYVGGPQSDRFLDIVRSWGASVAVMDADRHDRLAAATQVLTHASVLAFGVALAELGVSADELLAVAPPPHRALLALLARVAGGEPEVYWDVQAGNPYAGATRKALFDATAQVDRAAETLGDFTTLMKTADAALDNRSGELNAECQSLFDRIAEGHREIAEGHRE
ncbi:prephenate dehydrogenase [Rhodococcus sp. D-46]|uniref:prephenate dehydrogenase dimerization domain-containing protein n=1 Tax=unclassified Rhodococcus (in: high G+C Gram-positive bacteria) TaxID=192944 RepID=UPI0013F5D7C5|nr:prephenate dehydrogenase dimerization domain-containing protein [Rhodococcus sp. MH15]MBW0291197.1 prephenate dehydrogenase [Rhodococcus sp. MH15]NHE62702.1 prephenate dehydrogenase [Rhodococcus sp. D-46]